MGLRVFWSLCKMCASSKFLRSWNKVSFWFLERIMNFKCYTQNNLERESLIMSNRIKINRTTCLRCLYRHMSRGFFFQVELYSTWNVQVLPLIRWVNAQAIWTLCTAQQQQLIVRPIYVTRRSSSDAYVDSIKSNCC